MEAEKTIIEKTAYLFGCRHDDPSFDADDSYEHSDAADQLIETFGWNTVFPYWFQYLREQCPTPDDVLNFANLFFYYGGTDYPMRDPYPFVSYFYYRVDTKQYGAEATDILDSIAIPLLSHIGDISLESNPDYVPENDPKIQKAIANWKNKTS